MRSTYLNKAGLNDKQQAALDAIATGPRGAVMGMGGDPLVCSFAHHTWMIPHNVLADVFGLEHLCQKT